ncbi:MAG: FG-GAP repeat domain-containing protein, partial [Nitrospiria bacterium]
DFNEDKKGDLAVVDNDEDRLYILLNQGEGRFQKMDFYETGRSPYSATVNDFNGDHHLDVAIVSRFDRLIILLGKGDGTFLEGMVGDPGAIPTGIISGDYNNDSLIDLAIANNGSTSNDFVFFWGKGDGTFIKGERYKTGKQPLGLIAEDFNRDNFSDILVINGMGDSLTLFIHEEKGAFSKLRDLGADGGPASAVAADFNRDGLLDLVIVSSRSNSISFIPGKGDGAFHYPPLNIFTGSAPFFVLAEDFNEDGNIDLAVINNEDKTLSVLLGRRIPKEPKKKS